MTGLLPPLRLAGTPQHTAIWLLRELLLCRPLPLLQAHSWGPLEQILAEPGDLLLDLSDLQCDSCPGFVPLFG